jgi:hypothetical protein
MIGGFGFIWDMVDKMKENLSRLPSKQTKFKLGSKFMEGRDWYWSGGKEYLRVRK